MGGVPTLLVDLYFDDSETGWMVGGIDYVRHPGRPTEKRDVIPEVFHTTNGGDTWVNQTEANAHVGEFPRVANQGKDPWS